ncbi:MAG: site-2 protease family protein [Candidatus Obscuribacterales bacterium]|nr:site-2 protease family protein [Candidatus Obscuribacterales bacterium]
MPNIFSILLMLGILSILIIVHEFGHFAVARFFGFQTPVFGFGLPFGPSWTLGEKWGTQFKVHACLLGGYVAIPELGDESSMAHDAYGVQLKPFRKFPIWQRALVAFAGVAMNMIFAYFVMLAMVMMLGVQVDKVYVQGLAENIPVAREAGVLAGDRIASIDSLPVKTSEQVIDYLSKHKGTEVTLHILREPEALRATAEGEQKASKVDITLKTTPEGKVGMMLYRPVAKVDGSPLDLCGKAFTELWDLTSQMLSTLGRMMHNIAFGWMEPKVPGAAPQAGIGDLHGVLVVIKWGADLAESDWTKLFTFTALISMDLAIVNLLPIPALDGGHLFFQLLEAIRGKPMEERTQGELVKWGFISLLTLMAIIMVNDIRVLFTGELDFKLKSKKGQNVQQQKPPDDGKNAPDKSDKNSTAPAGNESSSTTTATSSETSPGSVGGATDQQGASDKSGTNKSDTGTKGADKSGADKGAGTLETKTTSAPAVSEPVPAGK